MSKMRNLSLCLLLTLLSYLFIPLSSYGPQIEIYALNVGQGDSTLIVTPSKTRILIDGGRDGVVIEQLDKIIPFWDRKIDLVMLSHPDADHLSGLLDVLKSYKVNNLALSPISNDSELYKSFINEAASEGVKMTNFIRDTNVVTKDGLEIKGLWPTLDSLRSEDTNGNSQVALLTYKYFTGLLTGDIDTKVAIVIEKNKDLVDVDYLKIPHHGSKYGFTIEQLAKLSPEISTISVGKSNRYGHPSAISIANLKSVGSLVHRTDKDGLIRIMVNQSGINISSE